MGWPGLGVGVMSGILLSGVSCWQVCQCWALSTLLFPVFNPSLRGKGSCHAHFTDQETEAWRSQVTLARPPGLVS